MAPRKKTAASADPRCHGPTRLLTPEDVRLARNQPDAGKSLIDAGISTVRSRDEPK
jgi:hypothetical protein